MDVPTWIIYGLKASEGEVQFELSREDYLKLWMYFEDRADKVKEAMFKTLTWTIGYAAALQGFIFLTLVDFDSSKASVRLHWLVGAAAAAGIVICLYSLFALYESGKHLQRNWARAKRCEAKFKKLDYIISGAGQSEGHGLEIWQQLYIIVGLFALAFTAVIIWAITDAKASGLIPG